MGRTVEEDCEGNNRRLRHRRNKLFLHHSVNYKTQRQVCSCFEVKVCKFGWICFRIIFVGRVRENSETQKDKVIETAREIFLQREKKHRKRLSETERNRKNIQIEIQRKTDSKRQIKSELETNRTSIKIANKHCVYYLYPNIPIRIDLLCEMINLFKKAYIKLRFVSNMFTCTKFNNLYLQMIMNLFFRL